MTLLSRYRSRKPETSFAHAVRARLSGEDGMTLAEMMVALFIFGVLGSLAFVTVINGSLNLKTVRQNTDLNEQARLVLNRMSRELRQASAITAAVNPDASDDNGERTCPSSPPPCFNPESDVAITLEVNFNDEPGHEAIEPNAEDPERLTYRYDRANRRLLLQTAAQSTPILTGNVSFFKLTYRSSHYKCDSNSDGQVTWQELEGTCGELSTPNSTLDAELVSVDQVIIEMALETGKRIQRYRTKVDLRNKA